MEHIALWTARVNDSLVEKQLWLQVQTLLKAMIWWETTQRLPLGALFISLIVAAVIVIASCTFYSKY